MEVAFGSAMVRLGGSATRWRRDSVAVRLGGGATRWRCDLVAVRLGGGATRWRCNSVAVRHVGSWRGGRSVGRRGGRTVGHCSGQTVGRRGGRTVGHRSGGMDAGRRLGGMTVPALGSPISGSSRGPVGRRDGGRAVPGGGASSQGCSRRPHGRFPPQPGEGAPPRVWCKHGGAPSQDARVAGGQRAQRITADCRARSHGRNTPARGCRRPGCPLARPPAGPLLLRP